jgi:hypothetical protein
MEQYPRREGDVACQDCAASQQAGGGREVRCIYYVNWLRRVRGVLYVSILLGAVPEAGRTAGSSIEQSKRGIDESQPHYA